MRQSRYYCVIPPYYIKNRRIIRSLILKINVGLEPTILSTQKTYVLTTIQIHRSKTIFRYRFYFFRHKKEIHYIPLSCTTVNQALPTVTSSVSVFVCNCLTDVSFMDFVRKHGNAPWTPPWKGDVITSSLHPHILKWVSKFTSHGLLRIYRKKHTSSVALPLMIPHGNQHVSTSWRSHLVPMTTFHTID